MKRRRSTTQRKSNETIDISKRRSSSPPKKIQRIDLTNVPTFQEPVDCENLSEFDKKLDSSLSSKLLGTCLYSVLLTEDTRSTHLFRKVDPTWVENVMGQMKSNTNGKHFRAVIIINIYPTSDDSEEEKENLIMELKTNFSGDILESFAFRKYFNTEVLNGNHSVQAIKQIHESGASVEIQNALGGPHYRYECKCFFDLDCKTAVDVAFFANKTLLHSKPFTTFDIIKYIYSEYQNPQNCTANCEEEKILEKTIREGIVRKFFSPDGNVNNFNAKIKFCNMPETSLAILEEMFTFYFVDIQLTLSQLAPFRIFDNEEKYNQVFCDYVKQSKEIVGNVLKEIELQTRQLSFAVLHTEKLLESSQIDAFKKKLVQLKKKTIQDLEKIKLQCKLIPLLINIIKKDDTFENLNLDTNKKFNDYCRDHKIEIDNFIDDDIKESLRRSVVTLSGTQKVKLADKMKNIFFKDCRIALNSLAGQHHTLENAATKSTLHIFCETITKDISPYVSLIIIDFMHVNNVEIEKIEKLIASYPHASLVILGKKHEVALDCKSSTLHTLWCCIDPNDSSVHKIICVTLFKCSAHSHVSIEPFVVFPGDLISNSYHPSVFLMKWMINCFKLDLSTAVLSINVRNNSVIYACSSYGVCSVNVMKSRNYSKIGELIKNLPFEALDALDMQPLKASIRVDESNEIMKHIQSSNKQ